MATYKRLTFETPKGDEDERSQRFMKGLGRELSTPALSIPYSTEGSSVYENVDRSIVFAAVKNRNELVDIVDKYRPLASVKTAKLFFEKSTYAMVQSANIRFDENATAISPEVYR